MAKLKALLVDLSGTLHIGNEATPRALHALRRLREAKVPIRFCSNTTKDGSRTLIDRLRGIGFDIRDDEVFTSLSAVKLLLQQRGARPLLILSPSALEDFKDFRPTDLDTVVVGLAQDKLSYEHLNQAFRLLTSDPAKRSSLIATHRALYFKDNDGELSLGPGGFISALEQAADVKAEVVGKPTRSFFEICLKSLERDGVRKEDWKDVAMIGDDWRNDLGEGAQELGLQRYLVKTGKYRQGDEERAQDLAGVYEIFADVVDSILA